MGRKRRKKLAKTQLWQVLLKKKSTIKSYRRANIDYLHLHAEDEKDYPLLEKYFQSAYNFIEQNNKKKKKKKKTDEKSDGKCVVHCVAGMNRSGFSCSILYDK